jgi:glyoxylase-like metal-dependent hydrolase (beta-lactamase superfamily II)
MQVGKVAIDRVVELERMLVPAPFFFPGLSSELLGQAAELFGPELFEQESSSVVLSVHSQVLRVGGRTIVVDCCIGNDKERPVLPEMHHLSIDFLGRLAAVGVKPEDVDLVLCTHLHPDHVGWNTRLSNGEWVPTFPNAKYLIARTEYEATKAERDAPPTDPLAEDRHRVFDDSILPIVQAGQAVFVEHDHVVERELDHGVRLESAPGHSAGQVTVHVESQGEQAVLSADVIHHPIQLLDLSLSQIGDSDPELATTTRRRLVETYADSGTIILPAHFPTPTAGRFVSDGDAYAYEWLDGTRVPDRARTRGASGSVGGA